ncbi:MAG: hypothetical protein K5889_00640 [Lachnospiraceae bacterium]|nr:hypothetical protein [Lachnospiraceae bacterium]
MLYREYKSSLFADLFSDAKRGLSIFNALMGTAYSDPAELEIATLKDAVFMHRKNDVALLVEMRLLMLEHQSTINPNMPLRGLQYYADSMDGYLEKRQLNIYGKKRIKIPAPFYYVLYNGREDAPDREALRLSDSFECKTEGYEWTASFVNINTNHNRELMEKCPELKGYAKLVEYIRENIAQGMEKEESVDTAVGRCIEEGYLVDYLRQHIGEARGMLLSGFNQEIYEKGLREEGWEAGIEEGRKAGIAEGREAGIEEGRKAGIAEGRENGIKEGVEQGRAKEKEHAIMNMLDLGLSKEMIAEKYPMELIEKVLKS